MNTSVTIRSVDEATAEWINAEKERLGISADALLLRLIRKGIEAEKKGEPEIGTYHDLDMLAGTWSDEEFTEFCDVAEDFGQIDENLWK